MTQVADTANKFKFDPFSHEIHHDPYPHYKALRENDPVYYNEERGFWLLTKYEDVFQAFRDFKNFSNIKGVALEADMGASPYPMVLTMDPPDHTKLRKVVQAAMLPKHIAATEPYIRKKTRELIRAGLLKGELDLVADYGCYLPMSVIARMIQLPEEDEDKIRAWVDDVVFREDGTMEVTERVAIAYMNVAGYFEDFVKEKEQNYNPEDQDLLTLILNAKKEGKMQHNEVIGFLILLGVAGNETTTKLIGNMGFRLWQYPEQRALAASDVLEYGKKCVEETMRFDGSSQILGRTLLNDVEIRGKLLKAGQRVGLCAISANRDEDKFENAEEYDITRNTMGHIGFGAGPHACLGAALARLEGQIAYEEILNVIPDYELHEDKLKRTHNPNVRGFTNVPVTFEPMTEAEIDAKFAELDKKLGAK